MYIYIYIYIYVKWTRHTITHARSRITRVDGAALSVSHTSGSDNAKNDTDADAPSSLAAYSTQHPTEVWTVRGYVEMTRSLRPAACLPALVRSLAWQPRILPLRRTQQWVSPPLGRALPASGHDADPFLIDVQTAIAPTSPCYLLIFVQGCTIMLCTRFSFRLI